MSWNRKHRLFSSFNCENKRKSTQKENSALRSVESTRNQTTQMRSFGRDMSNIPMYRKDNKMPADGYNQKRLVPKAESWERAKRAASVSGNQPNKQFLSKRGSNTLKTLRAKNYKNNASGMITYLPNLHNVSGASNSSKTRAGSNTSTHNKVARIMQKNKMPQMNNVITMSKEMVSTKVNGLGNLNVVKKNIKTKRSGTGTRQDSKSSFASDVNAPPKAFLSTHSRDGSSNKKRRIQSHTIFSSNQKGQGMNNSLHSTCSGNNSAMKPEDKLRRFKAKMERILATNIDARDRSDIEDPLWWVEYVNDCCDHMLKTEGLFLPTYGYMKSQPDINDRMRGILVDWLIEVHLKFKLVPETLFLTINLIDRYLEIEKVKRDKLQLVGVTAMLIACKYEEIYPPEIKDFVYITDNAYSKKEIMDMEYNMLKKFEFNVTVISSYRFIERFTKLSQDNEAMFFLAQYMLELALIEYKMIKYRPSMLASGALYLAHKIMGKSDSWPLKVEQYSGLKEKDVRPWAKDMCILLQGVNSSSLKAARKKFSLTKFGEVAKIQVES